MRDLKSQISAKAARANAQVFSTGIYPEREEAGVGWIDRVGIRLGGLAAPLVGPNSRNFEWICRRVEELAPQAARLKDEEIRREAQGLGQQMRREGFADHLVARAFALIREVARRAVRTPHYGVQLMGGLVLLRGMVAEMETGEGKTLTATLAAGAAALAGIPVHVITVNDYLAARDAEWMGPVYRGLGLTVGTIVHGLRPEERRAAYRCHVTYCTNKEVAFDYLRDRILLWDRPGPVRMQLERIFGEDSRVNRLVMRGLHFAIVDEADSVLIDEARTPLIISAETGNAAEREVFLEALEAGRSLVQTEDFTLSPVERVVELTEQGKSRTENFPWASARTCTNRMQREELVRQALLALHFFSKDQHYLVRDGKVQIIDEYTGRLMPDRSWEGGLHQLIEIKEGCEVTSRKEAKAKISYQRFFRRYLRLAGMTGTAREVAGELWSIYRLRVVAVPTRRPLIRRHHPDRICPTEEEKWSLILKEIAGVHMQGRPVLVGTRSVAASEHLSRLLEAAGLEHRVLNARQDRQEAEIIAQAGQRGRITVATNMAGRGTDIKLSADVVRLGGLYVIASERHESGRIDRQLFGRCARQGDPGSCRAYLSLEDELAAVYAASPIRRLTSLLLGIHGHRAGSLAGKALIRRAQRSAERLHARMRAHLLRVDEQIGTALAFSGRPE